MKKRRNRNRTEPLPEAPKHSALSHMLDLPEGMFGDFSQITLSGNREAVVEGCSGVLEYDAEQVRLSLGRMMVQFTGRNLQIRCMTGESVIVEGYIIGMQFLS